MKTQNTVRKTMMCDNAGCLKGAPQEEAVMKLGLSIITAAAIIFTLASASPSFAGEVISNPDGTTIWQAGIDGVEIEWANGSLNRIYSRASQPVNFPDRQGINKAQIIAEEKAKAAIIRFTEQQVASARVIAEVQNDMSKTTRNQGTKQEEDIQKSSQRQMLESLSEITSSASAGKLRGVVVLERGYDQKEEAAWVKVGISKKTMGASESLRDALSGKPAAAATEQKSTSPMQFPGSETQRSQQKEW
jgi:hypothetical protein